MVTSKRVDGDKSPSGRPFIGRKGIGKLALLSSAEKITIFTKTSKTAYVSGLIDNRKLDKAITHDLKPEEYSLGVANKESLLGHMKNHPRGTIVHFENIKDGIRSTLENLEKIVALYFRFSLIDNDFNIYINDKLVDHSCLTELISNTQFMWTINKSGDPYVKNILKGFTDKDNEHRNIKTKSPTNDNTNIGGFVASTKKPSNLTIFGTGEKISVDLFVNGRLRERNILRHIPSARVTESYLYGQIHFNN